MVAGRVPFEATVNRAPGSLFVVDNDAHVRNTYLLKITNNDTGGERITYRIRVEGLDNAEVVAPPLELAASESRTTPLVIRVPVANGLRRTILITVHVTSSQGELVLNATFKTGAELRAGRTTE
jgi:hypothetical protein